jgi:tight adherence protein B
MDPTLLIAVLAFIAVGGVGLAFSGNPESERAGKRAREINKRVGKTRPTEMEMANARRKANVQESLKELGAQQKRSRKASVSIKGQIEQAGLTISESIFWIASVVAGVVAGLGIFMASGGNILLSVGALLGAGLGLPRWILGFLCNRRQKKFIDQLADGIDIIVRGVKSGLPLNQCLRIIAAESPEPLRTEFRQVIDGQAMGVPLDANLQRMFERMPLPEVNFFNIVLIIQQKTGGNLSESLGNLSTVLRSRKLLKEKVKALSSEAQASAMIIGALPFIVMGLVYMIRPNYIAILFTEPQGQAILVGCALMMGTGIFVMKKMVDFKF